MADSIEDDKGRINHDEISFTSVGENTLLFNRPGNQNDIHHRHHQVGFNPTSTPENENENICYHVGFSGRSIPEEGENENIHHRVNFINRSTPEHEDVSMEDVLFKSPEETSRISYDAAAASAGTSNRLKRAIQGGFAELSEEEESSPLGLRLRKTPSLINLLQTRLNDLRERKQQHKMKMKDPMIDEKSENEKLKASNFPAMHLKIGNWERISRHEGDLVAKCYYKKGRLVWEVLEGALKSKIEIQWSDIIGIRATKASDESGILEIELNEKPLFFKETNPQPRKHTLWQQADDFTGGQALICRRHIVKFEAGTLDKHYERLLQYDHRLFMLSKAPFPSKPPYFQEYNQIGFNNQYNNNIESYNNNIHNNNNNNNNNIPIARYYYNYHHHHQAHHPMPISMAGPPPTFPNIIRPTSRPQQQLPSVHPNYPTIPVRSITFENHQNMVFLNEATLNYQVGVPPATHSVVLNNSSYFPNYPNNMGYPNQDLNAITQGQQSHLFEERSMSSAPSPSSILLTPVERRMMSNNNQQAAGGMVQNDIVKDNLFSPDDDHLMWSLDQNWLAYHQHYGLHNQTNGSSS